MRFNFYIGLICIICYSNSYSQIIEPSAGLDKHILQIEMEAQYAVQKGGMEKKVTWSVPSALFRYGLFKNVELLLNTPLIIEQVYENDHLVYTIYRFANIQVGASINLLKQNKLIPEIAFMTRVIIPVKKDDEFNGVGEIMAFNFSNSIIEKLALNYNIGYVHGTDNSNTGYYIINLTYNFNQKKHFFIENFSDFDSKSVISRNLNVGGGYNINKNMGLDFFVAKGLNYDLFYTSIRFTWVIDTTKQFF